MWSEILLLGVLGCGGSDEPAPEPAPLEPKKHALVIVIDTLRAETVAKAHTPNIDAVAARGDSVALAWAAGTWTVPSVISMFSGMPVRQHGWNGGPGLANDFPAIPQMPLLAEVLTKNGFVSTGLYANDFIDGKIGFSRGFDEWRKISDATAVKQAKQRIDKWDDGERHFLYVHLLGPHSPLRPSDAAKSKYELDEKWFENAHGFLIGAAKRNQEEGIREAYETAYTAVTEDTDVRVGEILALLGDYREDTLVVITSDHGEMIDDHGFCGHGYWVWEELTHVPFIVDGGGDLPTTLGTAALPDVITTSLGVKHEWPVTRADALPLVSEREGKTAVSPDGRYKGIWDDGFEVYDLQTDPKEATVTDQQREEIHAARRQWQLRYPAGTLGEANVELHPDTIEALEVLGYMESEE